MSGGMIEEQAVDIIASDTRKDMSELAGKYLTFRLSGEEYGIEILKVKEIIGLMDITKVPGMPTHVRGVINLRGKVIPVVDLRTKFDMVSTEDTDETCIIVVDMEQKEQSAMTGILVDSVSEVLDIPGDKIEGPPSFGAAMDIGFIMGMAKIGDSVKMLLDIVEVLT